MVHAPLCSCLIPSLLPEGAAHVPLHHHSPFQKQLSILHSSPVCIRVTRAPPQNPLCKKHCADPCDVTVLGSCCLWVVVVGQHSAPLWTLTLKSMAVLEKARTWKSGEVKRTKPGQDAARVSMVDQLVTPLLVLPRLILLVLVPARLLPWVTMVGALR